MSVRLEIWNPTEPGDVARLRSALNRLPLARVRHLAVLGKTEGPATLNDFSRDLASVATDTAIREVGGENLLARSWRLFSTGCEGIATPSTALLADVDDGTEPRDAQPRLAFGAARSRCLAPEVRCSRTHILRAAETVREAIVSGGLTNEQVTLVLIKSPILPAACGAHVAPSLQRHAGSTGAARGAAALGAAMALGEVNAEMLGPDPIGRDTHQYARRAMVFSGTETDKIETIVLGERPIGGDLRICGALLSDMLDGAALREPLSRMGTATPLLVFFKASIAADSRLRRRRTTVLGSDLPADKQLRAAASGLIGSWFGTVDTFISGGAEHQGPPGACLCAIIAGDR